MDEYLFIVMAKLGAERLKLEREARAVAGSHGGLHERWEPPPVRHQSQRARRFNPEIETLDFLGEQS